MNTMTLKMPNSFVDVDREEMEYVDGGLYITNAQIRNTVSAFGFANKSTVGGLAAALTPIIPIALSWVNALPIGGQILFVAICGATAAVAYQFAYAYFNKKGVNITTGRLGLYFQVK